jgi:hypothetical protein
MLLVYSHTLGLGTDTLEAMFGVYALGLIPGHCSPARYPTRGDGAPWSCPPLCCRCWRVLC